MTTRWSASRAESVRLPSTISFARWAVDGSMTNTSSTTTSTSNAGWIGSEGGERTRSDLLGPLHPLGARRRRVGSRVWVRADRTLQRRRAHRRAALFQRHLRRWRHSRGTAIHPGGARARDAAIVRSTRRPPALTSRRCAASSPARSPTTSAATVPSRRTCGARRAIESAASAMRRSGVRSPSTPAIDRSETAGTVYHRSTYTSLAGRADDISPRMDGSRVTFADTLRCQRLTTRPR